jgi:hypothetical protein
VIEVTIALLSLAMAFSLGAVNGSLISIVSMLRTINATLTDINRTLKKQ